MKVPGPKGMLRILGWVFLLSMGCTSAQQAKVAKDAKKALDDACNARALDKLVTADGGH